MTEQKYNMHLVVPASLVGTIIEVLNDTGVLKSLEVIDEPTSDEAPKKQVRYAHGQRNKGIKGIDLVIQSLGRGSMSVGALEAEFIKRGFSSSSLSPTLHILKSEGRIIV